MRSWLKNISRIVLIFLIVFVSWHYFKKSASLIKQIKNKSVVMAYCMDGDTPVCDDSNSGDSGIDPVYKEIPDNPSKPDWPQWRADLGLLNPDNPDCRSCSRWEGDELHVFDEHGNLIRVWQPYESYEDPSERDGDSGSGDGGGQTCTLYCPASNAPACGGSCSGCYQSALESARLSVLRLLSPTILSSGFVSRAALSLRAERSNLRATWGLLRRQNRYSETCITCHDRTGMNPPCY
jgi:hypothetical protein